MTCCNNADGLSFSQFRDLSVRANKRRESVMLPTTYGECLLRHYPTTFGVLADRNTFAEDVGRRLRKECPTFSTRLRSHDRDRPYGSPVTLRRTA